MPALIVIDPEFIRVMKLLELFPEFNRLWEVIPVPEPIQGSVVVVFPNVDDVLDP